MSNFRKYTLTVVLITIPFLFFGQDLTFSDLYNLKTKNVEFAENLLSKRGWEILNTSVEKDKFKYITFDNTVENAFQGKSWIRISWFDNENKILEIRWTFDSQFLYNKLLEEINNQPTDKKEFKSNQNGVTKSFLIKGVGVKITNKTELEARITDGKYEISFFNGL